MNNHGPGTIYCLRAGHHRISHAISHIQNGDQFVGMRGDRTILSGAKAIKDWTKQGDLWVASGQKQRNAPEGNSPCKPVGSPQCVFPEDVFRDHRRLNRVKSKGDVGARSFYFDYANDKIYVGANPAGHIMEGAVAEYAFHNQGSNVVIRNLVIEKFANHAGAWGAVFAREVNGWDILYNLVRLNHGKGIAAGKARNLRIIGNRVYRNGQMGIGGGPDFSIVADNHVVKNHTLDFAVGWEAGGVKFGDVKESVFRNNVIEQNEGFGLWCDVGCVNVKYIGNVVNDNAHGGIHHEISGPAVIRNNVVKRNGQASHQKSKLGAGRGAGIMVVASQNVEVYNNRVIGNGNGITAISSGRGPIRDLRVHDNVLVLKRDQKVGLWGSGYTGAGNRWYNNTYKVCKPGLQRFKWASGLDFTGWRQVGHDVNGDLVRAKGCVSPA
jgi:hypothetical protein